MLDFAVGGQDGERGAGGADGDAVRGAVVFSGCGDECGAGVSDAG